MDARGRWYKLVQPSGCRLQLNLAAIGSDAGGLLLTNSEHDERECVAENKFTNSGKYHGNTSKEVPPTDNRSKGSRASSLKSTQSEHCVGERDQEA